MVWLVLRLAVAMFVLNCLVQCTVPNPSAIPIRKQPTHSELRTSPETKLPNTDLEPTIRPTVKTTKKITAKKTAAPALVNEFPLNDILFKGQQSSKSKDLYYFTCRTCVHLPDHSRAAGCIHSVFFIFSCILFLSMAWTFVQLRYLFLVCFLPPKYTILQSHIGNQKAMV